MRFPVVSLALLDYKTDEAAGEERGKDYVGVHHIGFWVDDLDETGDAFPVTQNPLLPRPEQRASG